MLTNPFPIFFAIKQKRMIIFFVIRVLVSHTHFMIIFMKGGDISLKERNLWLILFCLTLLVTACSQQAQSSGKLYDANQIREDIADLDPDDPEDAEILYGEDLFNTTEIMLPENVGNEQSCLSCHGKDGLEPNSPMVGVTSKYPTEHHGKDTSMEDRINGCFQRSMNGKPLDKDSDEMEAMVSFFEFISKDVKDEDDITWRMTNDNDQIPEPDTADGAELFVDKQCIVCHATDGSGGGPNTGPPLWGDGSFNDAAGMNRISKAAAFIQNNMPKDQPGTLTDQEAADLAAFLLSHERPIADPDKLGDYHLDPDRDYMTKDRREKIREGTFDWSELDVVE
jgi:thiosulfate dehydrogenase